MLCIYLLLIFILNLSLINFFLYKKLYKNIKYNKFNEDLKFFQSILRIIVFYIIFIVGSGTYLSKGIHFGIVDAMINFTSTYIPICKRNNNASALIIAGLYFLIWDICTEHQILNRFDYMALLVDFLAAFINFNIRDKEDSN